MANVTCFIRRLSLGWIIFAGLINSNGAWAVANRSVLEEGFEVGQSPVAPALAFPIAQQVPPPPAPPSLDPSPPPEPLPPLPAPEDLLQPTPAPAEPSLAPGEIPVTIQIDRFNIVCSTATEPEIDCFFDPDVLAEVAKRAVTGDLPPQTASEPEGCPEFEGTDLQVDRSLTFAELLQARTAITDYYTCRGYITSGALIPPQVLQGGVVTIQVVEGSLEEINITGTDRLNASYVRSRLAIATDPPLNVNELLQALQLLQLNPLIETISAELQAGTRPGTSILQVEVAEADTWSIPVSIDNGRSPSVGSFRQQIGVSQANLLGLGDGISISYTHTDGSDQLDGIYVLPLNPRNGTLSLAYGTTSSEVIEPPFDVLEIEADSRYYELTYRQPLLQTPTEEFALGLVASRQESQTELGIDDIGPFPLSPGADEEGRTRVSALRFFQEWTRRSSQEVLAARSQFSLGLDWVDATVNDDAPDSRFFAWRGQGQWVRLLARDSLLLLRTDAQLTGDSLVSLEQFGVGGIDTVRGYRQDTLLTDNGALFSAEVRLPILRVPEVDGLLQVVPFFDAGVGWNVDIEDPDPNVLLGTGLGLLWQMGENFSARIDWGIPLIEIESEDRTWQENGIYFSVIYSPSF